MGIRISTHGGSEDVDINVDILLHHFWRVGVRFTVAQSNPAKSTYYTNVLYAPK
jgi:hypothetical protein